MLRRAAVTTAAVPLVALASILAGCPASQVDICYGDACGDTSEGGTVDAHQTLPPGCNEGDDPTQNLACVDNSIGLFVSQSGADTNQGTKEAPFHTLSAAFQHLNAQQTRIYVCQGSYEEDSLVMTQAASIYGGFACDWTYAGVKAAPHVTARQTTGATLVVEKIAAPITIEALAIDGPTPANPGESSIGVLVVDSKNVTLTNVTLTAQAAKDGTNGVLAPVSYPDQNTLNGKPASGATPGTAVSFTCPAGGTTVGGAGGASGFKGDDGLPALGGGKGGTGTVCGSGGAGTSGTAAGAATDGAGATVSGTLDEDGWKASGGGAGSAGGPGQGGGGGAGYSGNGGGGGGAGGCGGAPGPSGGGGGASIAFASFGSTVVFSNSTLVAGNGGAGGKGAAGQTGQTAFGLAGSSASACAGGTGGAGGNGGAGGGGAGGISVGILSKNGTPTTDSQTDKQITVGTPGGKGAGGNGNDGIAGVAAQKMPL